MASITHNFIVSALVRRIRRDGFRILYLDSKYQDTSTNKFEIPPKIINHKPDIIAIKDVDLFCIGEAKTTGDIFCDRTRNQIKDFLELVKINPKNMLYLGVPLEGKNDLLHLLGALGLAREQQIDTIYIPEKLFPNEET